jgi:hypothetical protein
MHEGSSIVIRIAIQEVEPLTGVALNAAGDKREFEGWLCLLGALSELLGTVSCAAPVRAASSGAPVRVPDSAGPARQPDIAAAPGQAGRAANPRAARPAAARLRKP